MSKPQPVLPKDSSEHADRAISRAERATAMDARRWQDENAEAIRSINDWVEKNGLPLDRYRVS